VIIDDNINSSAMKKINETLPSIAGAFSQFDEVAVYTYGDNVHTLADFAAAGDRIAEILRSKKLKGHMGGVPVLGGPLQSNGPSYNGHPMDPGAPQVNTPARESHVMNDALLRAAQDLGKRERGQRKTIFLIREGKEEGSEASYRDVLKVLLSYDITVYAIGVDTAAIPIYDKLSQIHVPGEGFGNLLPKYVSATGGEYFAEFTRNAIEQTYARLTEIARNQYTLGYTTRITPASTYRTIEVRVLRPDLKVVARDGYYPLPPRRAPTPENPPSAP
jgi:VWFA-related protein